MKTTLLAAALLLALSSAAFADEYQYPQDGFAIALPTKPNYSVASQQAGGKDVAVHTYALTLADGGAFVVSATQIGGNVADEAGLAAQNAAATAKKLNGTIKAQMPVKVGSHAGVQADIATATNFVRCRYFFVNGKTYTLIAILPLGAPVPAPVDTAMTSFRLLP